MSNLLNLPGEVNQQYIFENLATNMNEMHSM